ncbi:hypothetical protein Htur_2728 [Haloterrigena turkmenica DSM 5511]|uniref:DUF3006 domain-containing protein n=1 Tax=Haloterrigena turkmenica (strain ATCC 51198 / DSM 5511 / JCM 9101 / NCIMB 13204 / VKM B-1734 / 4k) TaxID=543526 RepID=D2RWV0_HALTV|nr:DUF3006 family protein [Haloterrigena turkmenica]ADB61601.1 hypothetical protein Htur_2728 [Haloterrigena turkmenica DSM 5511]
MTEHYTAVLDRIVDGETAVLLLEDDGTVVDERVLDVERLPEDGRHEGALFDVELADDSLEADNDLETGDGLEDDDFTSVDYRPSLERDRREEAQDRFDRLSERLSDE